MLNVSSRTIATPAQYLPKICGDDRQFCIPADTRTTPQWRLSLLGLIADLERLPALTELRFLQAGTRLQEISARLLAVGAAADRTAAKVSGEETQAVIQEMALLLDRLEEDFIAADRTVGQVSDLLNGIVDELADMGRLMESFKRHVGNLRMLKLLTNIQVASLTKKGMSLKNVASDIGTLSENIQLKSNAILSRGRALNADLIKGSAMVAGLGITQQKLNRTMVGAVRTKIVIMADMHAKCTNIATNLSNRSGEMSRNVGSIVVSLQFQDITRQQLEHARDALIEVEKRLAPAAGGADTGLLSADLAGICVLQVAQISNSAAELVSAVSGIDSGLQAVSREASDSAARIHGLFSQADGVGRSSLADIELGLKSLLAAFAENMSVREKLAGIVQATTLAMGEITGFAEEIDLVGSEIRLIALNAIIKAAQAGKEGAAFGVIAATIKQQSDDICSQATTINTTIRAITRHVTDLRHGALGQDQGSTTLRSDELAMTVDKLKGLINETGELLLGTDMAAKSLTEAIDAATAALASRELIGTVQNDLIPKIERFATGLPAGVPKGLQGRWTEGIQDAELRYTMGSERAVHQELTGAVVPGGWKGSAGGDGHFDNNIEFF